MLFRQFISASWVVGRWLALALGLSLSAPVGVCAQAPGASVHVESSPTPGTTTTHIFLDGPPQKGPFPVFYVDGQRLDSAAVVNKLNPNDIESISVLKDFDARLLGSDEGRRGVILIVTKVGQHTRAVRAFNRRLERLSRRQP